MVRRQQAAEIRFDSKFKPQPVIWQSLLNLKGYHVVVFQKTIEGLDSKINGRALGAALQHSLGWMDWRAQTQGVSKSAAVAAGCYRLA